MATTRAIGYMVTSGSQARCVLIPQDVGSKGKGRILSIIEFWIPQIEGILNQLDPFILWGEGNGDDVETGLYIMKMLLIEVCQRNLR